MTFDYPFGIYKLFLICVTVIFTNAKPLFDRQSLWVDVQYSTDKAMNIFIVLNWLTYLCVSKFERFSREIEMDHCNNSFYIKKKKKSDLNL